MFDVSDHTSILACLENKCNTQNLDMCMNDLRI